MSRYSNLIRDIKALSVDSGIPAIKVIFSFLICRFLYGASWDNFQVLKMYAMTNKERKRVYTFKRQKKISDFLNKNANDTNLHILMDKNKFNAAFGEFIVRDWYDSTEPDRKRFDEFMHRNERFLLKPILSSQGKGIELYNSSEVDLDSFYENISLKKVILEGFIEQHSELKSINPSSVNTIRLITARYGEHVHVIHGGGFAAAAKMLL